MTLSLDGISYRPVCVRGNRARNMKGGTMYDPDVLLGDDPRREFEQMLEGSCAAGKSFALMLVNLDGFEGIMVRYSRAVADLLIYEVSSRLRDELRDQDVLARFGSSQFAVLVTGAQRLESTADLARKLIGRLESAITVAGTRFRLTASVGITLFPQHGKEWSDLLDNAEAAAHDAMTQGRGRISISFPAVR